MKTVAPVVARGTKLVLAAALALFASPSPAQIQINPLPESKAATVTQLGAHELTAGDLQPWLDEQMTKAMRSSTITGAVVVVVKDGNVVVSKGYGYADVAAKKPVDPASTMFRVGAMSGVVTATAVMQLVEKHKLDLDADVNRYLDFTIPPHEGKPVTLRDLLTHTAGFEDVRKDLYITDAKRIDRDELGIHQGSRIPTRIYPPAQVAAYSTYGMALAGYIVQRASGQRFDEYTEQHIFEPLGLQHTTFRQSPAQWQDLASSAGPVGTPEPLRKLVIPTPATGLAISAGDMARFMVAQLQFGRAGEAQLLEQASVKQMQAYLRAAIPGLPGMALGFAHMDRSGQTVLGHSGDFNGFHSLLALFPDQHAGIFVATVGGDAAPLLHPLVEQFSDRYFPPLPQLKRPTLATAKTHAGQLAGRYTSSITSQSNVLALRERFHEVWVGVASDGTLRVPQLGSESWREVQPYVWVDDASGRRLAAVVRDGKVRMWSIDTLSPTQVFLPATGWTPTRMSAVLTTWLVVFVLIALSWPLAALLRQRGLGSALPEGDERWYRLSRIAPILYLLFAGGWALMLPRLGAPHLEIRLLLLQIVGLLAVLGTIPILMETWCAWRTPDVWWRRISDVILLLACLGAIAFIVNFHLLGPSFNY